MILELNEFKCQMNVSNCEGYYSMVLYETVFNCFKRFGDSLIMSHWGVIISYSEKIGSRDFRRNFSKILTSIFREYQFQYFISEFYNESKLRYFQNFCKKKFRNKKKNRKNIFQKFEKFFKNFFFEKSFVDTWKTEFKSDRVL